MAASMPMKILLVDDEKNIRQTLTQALTSWGHDVTPAANVDDAVAKLKSSPFDFLLTDFRLENKNGIDLLKAAKQTHAPPVAVLMTAYASFENAVNAVKEGAFDYLPKPFSNAQLEHLVKRVSLVASLRRENERLRQKAGARQDYFQGQTSTAMVRLEEFVRKVAPTDAGVLLIGESGTGKTELSKLIHSLSPRAVKTFGVVNCTTLAETLLESELFGHVKGAFTGATHDHIGRLEHANHGTVLIDEVGDLSLNGQTKLLRFLQEKTIERVGGNTSITLDVRVIAATNRNLEEAVKEGRFREDLYFRLNMFECHLVPLRHRKEDLPPLIQRFLDEFQIASLPDAVRKALMDYSWPGNVRELRNVIERLALLSHGREPFFEDLPDTVRDGSKLRATTGSRDEALLSLEELERRQIEKVLAREPNQEKAAEILGITTVTLWRKRKQYGLP
jgi:NtrC-family two-component system response regulator AlgB